MARQYIFVGVLLLLNGCASTLPPHLDTTSVVELRETPFFPQKAFQCGPAALATVLTESGVRTNPEALAPQVFIPERRGSLQLELLAATRRYGRVPYVIDADVRALVAELETGRPVLVFQNLGLRILPVWHFAVVVGFTPGAREVVLRSGTTRRRTMSYAKFLKTWQQAGSWGMVVLQPGELPAMPDADNYISSVAALEATGQYGAAVLAYAAAVDKWPGNTTAMLGLGNSHYALGDLELAEATYRGIIARHGDHVIALNNLAQVLADQGCFTEAHATIDMALAKKSSQSGLEDMLRRTRADVLDAQGSGRLDRGKCRSSFRQQEETT